MRHGTWDTQPIYLVWTGQDEDQVVVQHTSKSLIAQMFSPNGTSNHWFDQVRGNLLFIFIDIQLICISNNSNFAFIDSLIPLHILINSIVNIQSIFYL